MVDGKDECTNHVATAPTTIPTKAILFFSGCSEVNITWLVTSEVAYQRARKVLFTCVVYINTGVLHLVCQYLNRLKL